MHRPQPSGGDTAHGRLPEIPGKDGQLASLAAALSRLSTSRFNLRAALASDCGISLLLVGTGVAIGNLRAAPALLTLGCGALGFTFLEYAAHRWLFHGNTGPFEAGHRRHHQDPLGYDALPFFMPPLFMASLALVFALVIPVAYAFVLAGTIAAGYAAYGISHAVIHVRRFRSPRARRWAGFHNIHHYHPETNFGVTSGLWDALLGTRYQRSPRSTAQP